MAYRVANTDPLEVNYKTIVGVSVPFIGASSGGSTTLGADAVFNSNFTTTDQIRSNLINYILTNKGERILNPNYGSDLKRYLFSNMTNESLSFENGGDTYNNIGLNDLKSLLSDGIKNNFPEVNVRDVTITPSYDTNAVNISITYSFLGSPNTSLNITI
jgi:hypothetical protein